MAKPVRRVLTGHNREGRSIIWKDENAPNWMEVEAMGGLRVTDLWVTEGAPADNSEDRDTADRPIQLEPPKNGSVFRVVDFPPDSTWMQGADGRAGFEAIGAGHAAAEGSDDPMMHVTNTTDYAIVLEGEVWAVMEDGETCMRAGDVLVQRGTMHSWRVRGDEPARVAFILVDAAPR
ncbi:MAG: cupin domain-containing protein [Myxococcales bacterium]|nr:cupin domain-containing protein [Myxococcales bacterium]